MKKYTWVVEVNSGQECTEADYDTTAGQMCNLLVATLTNTEMVQGLTVCNEWQSCDSEIEVSYNGETIVGKALIDISCVKASLTKPRLLAALREAAPQWPDLSVSKRSA
jgi:hypothetical protein